jgi:hypothetical protein
MPASIYRVAHPLGWGRDSVAVGSLSRKRRKNRAPNAKAMGHPCWFSFPLFNHSFSRRECTRTDEIFKSP